MLNIATEMLRNVPDLAARLAELRHAHHYQAPVGGQSAPQGSLPEFGSTFSLPLGAVAVCDNSSIILLIDPIVQKGLDESREFRFIDEVPVEYARPGDRPVLQLVTGWVSGLSRLRETDYAERISVTEIWYFGGTCRDCGEVHAGLAAKSPAGVMLAGLLPILRTAFLRAVDVIAAGENGKLQ